MKDFANIFSGECVVGGVNMVAAYGCGCAPLASGRIFLH
jgi:hypothetical protein